MIRLSNSRRRDLTDILDDARGLIGDKTVYYICEAIHRSHGEPRNKDYLTTWIDRMLTDGLVIRCCSLDSWLLAKGYVSNFSYVDSTSNGMRKLRRTRLAWIDWMRNELWRTK